MTFREYQQHKDEPGFIASLPDETLVPRSEQDLIVEFGLDAQGKNINLVNEDGSPSVVSIKFWLSYIGKSIHFRAGKIESDAVDGFGRFYRWECEQMVPDGGDIVPSDQDPIAFLLGGAS